MALWEIAQSRGVSLQHLEGHVRWTNNLGLVFFNSFVLRLVPSRLLPWVWHCIHR